MMCRQLRSPLSLTIATAALILSSTYAAALADNEEAPSLRSVLSEFGLSAKHRKPLEDGAIVSVVAEPVFRKELRGAVAMRLPVRISEIAQRIRTGINITADPGMTEYGEIDSEHNETDLERAAFSWTELAEALRLFHVHPGKEFNLSAAEIAVVGERLGVYPSARDGQNVRRRLRRPIAWCSPGAFGRTASVGWPASQRMIAATVPRRRQGTSCFAFARCFHRSRRWRRCFAPSMRSPGRRRARWTRVSTGRRRA